MYASLSSINFVNAFGTDLLHRFSIAQLVVVVKVPGENFYPRMVTLRSIEMIPIMIAKRYAFYSLQNPIIGEITPFPSEWKEGYRMT